MRSELDIGLHRCANGLVRASGSLAVPPFWCRWDGSTLWIVGSAATPVGEDDISIHLQVGRGVVASVRNVAATVVYAGFGEGTLLRTDIEVAEDATLIWQPEPLIVTGRALHQSTTTLRVDEGGSVLADETVVFGRSNETAGVVRTTLDLQLGSETAALTSFDTALPRWDGPGGTNGAKVSATRVVVCPHPNHPSSAPAADQDSAVLRPERGGAIATALGPTPLATRALLDQQLKLGSEPNPQHRAVPALSS